MIHHRAPQVISSLKEIRQWRSDAQGLKKGSSEKVTIGLVPTMGALHEGHAHLLRTLRPRCDLAVLSIFVNPLQFGAGEDLKTYPRTWEEDLRIAEREGVDVVFAPEAQELYPHGFSTQVEETQLSVPLCGAFRPGHFRGVSTIVLKLFHLVQPHLALFGLKDVQQFFVLKKMVEDLNLNIHVEGVPTVRESSGLALSSRNRYLSREEAEKAPLLYQCLNRIQAQAQKINPALSPNEGREQIFRLLTLTQEQLQNAGFRVQYLELRRVEDLSPIKDGIKPGESYVVAAAAFLGRTRLIDNVIFSTT
ncbi:MAG: pantoate--beta-alanine ligase [Bdellovibrionia bacterium]